MTRVFSNNYTHTVCLQTFTKDPNHVKNGILRTVSRKVKITNSLFQKSYRYGMYFAVLLDAFQRNEEECFGIDDSMAEAGFGQDIRKGDER